jgi:predicted kinase
MATLHVIVGLPGAGKTTLARRLETSLPALRLTPDEWMVPLFGEPETKRDEVEGLLIGIALRGLALGIDAIADFGVWSRDERTCLRHLARDVGASTQLHYLPVEPDEQWQRLSHRDDPLSFEIDRTAMDRYATLFEPPSANEQAGTDDRPDDPDWPEWSRIRWPTLTG